jgi:hypothetical protein
MFWYWLVTFRPTFKHRHNRTEASILFKPACANRVANKLTCNATRVGI